MTEEQAEPRTRIYWGLSAFRLLVPVVVATWVLLASLMNRVPPPADLTFVVAAVTPLMLLFGVARLEVRATGVRIGLGPWGYPYRLLRWSDVSSVRVVRVSPFFGRGAKGVGFYCVRPGKGLQFNLANGSHVAVSVGAADASLRRIHDTMRYRAGDDKA